MVEWQGLSSKNLKFLLWMFLLDCTSGTVYAATWR